MPQSQSSRRIVLSDDEQPVNNSNRKAVSTGLKSRTNELSPDLEQPTSKSDRPRRQAFENALRDPVWGEYAPGKRKKRATEEEEGGVEEPTDNGPTRTGKRLKKASPRRLAAAEYEAPDMNADPSNRRTVPKPLVRSQDTQNVSAKERHHDDTGPASQGQRRRQERDEEDEDEEMANEEDDDNEEEHGEDEGDTDGETSEPDDPDIERDDPRALRNLFDSEKPFLIDNHDDAHTDDDSNNNNNEPRDAYNAKAPRTRDDGRAIGLGKEGSRSKSKSRTADCAEPKPSRVHSPRSPPPRPSVSSIPRAPCKRTRTPPSDSEDEQLRQQHKEVRPSKKPKAATSSLGDGSTLERLPAAGTAKAKAHKKSAGSVARRDHEIPRVSSPGRDEPADRGRSRSVSDHDGGQSDVDFNENISDSDPNIELVQPDKAGHKLALLDQRPRVRKTAQLAMKTTQTNLLLINAFPDGPDKYTDFARDALLASADALGFKDIKTRLKRDADYAHDLASLPVQRISTFRGKVKALTDQAVSKAYDLEIGNTLHVKWLKTGLRYIYPNDYKNDNVRGNEPYGLDIFAQTIRQAWFKSPRSFGWTITDKFASSLPEKPSEKEIPAPMLALVATAAYASILDHETDVYEASDFTANDYADAYNEHIRVLSAIKQNDLRAYHALMHGLYLRVCGPKAARTARNSDIGDALMFLNIKGMARD